MIISLWYDKDCLENYFHTLSLRIETDTEKGALK